MRLGISSYTYSWAVGIAGCHPAAPLTALGLLEKANRLGVSLVQVCDNLPLDRLPASELASFRTIAANQGIQIEVGTRGIAPDHLRRYLELAVQLGSPILRVVIDTATHQPDEEEINRTLRSLLPEFEHARVCLAIENHDRFLARQLAALIRQLDSPQVGICLDTANSFGALEGPEVVVETLGPLTVNLHVKDFAIQRLSHNMGFVIEGRPAGQGRLNVPWLLQSLRYRDPNAVLELWTPPEETLDATIAKEDAWAAASVAYLRQLLPGS